MTLGRKWSPYHQANLYSALSDTFQNQLLPGGHSWQSITFYNFQTPLPQKSTVFCCCFEKAEFSEGVGISQEACKIFHRSTRTWKKGTKNSYQWDDPATTNRNLGSLGLHHLDVINRKPGYCYPTQDFRGAKATSQLFQEVKYMPDGIRKEDMKFCFSML